VKRILLICSEYPLPENSGTSIRTMNFVRYFEKYGTIDIAYSQKTDSKQDWGNIFSNEYLLERGNESVGFKWRFLKGILTGVPLPVQDISNKSKKLILECIIENNYDYIIARYIHYTHVLLKLNRTHHSKTIIDVDDVFSGPLYGDRYRNINGILGKLLIGLNKLILLRYEKKCFKFGAVLFCSNKDRKILSRKSSSTKTHVVPNIYCNQEFGKYDFEDGYAKGNTLLFVGSLNYKPNIDGLVWFLDSIFPVFKNKYSDAKILIVGRSPTEEIKRLCENDQSIDLHSNVADVKKYYKRCNVSITPVLSGGGTRIKILESMLAHRPVMSTPIGAEGLDFANDKDLLLFDSTNNFCHQYKKLLDENYYHSIVSNAKRKVEKGFSLQSFNITMRNVLQSIRT